MTSSDKAKRPMVLIGSSDVEGFQMPDGSYRVSQAQAASLIDDASVYALRFGASKGSKALLGENHTDSTPNFFRSKTFKSLWGRSFTPQELVSSDSDWKANLKK